MKIGRDCSSPLHSGTLRSSPFRSTHRLSLVFPGCSAGIMTPLAHRAAPSPAAALCPLLTPCFASCSSLLIMERCGDQNIPIPEIGRYMPVFFSTKTNSLKNNIISLREKNDNIMLSLPNLVLSEARISPPLSRSGVKFFFL